MHWIFVHKFKGEKPHAYLVLHIVETGLSGKCLPLKDTYIHGIIRFTREGSSTLCFIYDLLWEDSLWSRRHFEMTRKAQWDAKHKHFGLLEPRVMRNSFLFFINHPVLGVLLAAEKNTFSEYLESIWVFSLVTSKICLLQNSKGLFSHDLHYPIREIALPQYFIVSEIDINSIWISSRYFKFH